MSRIKKIIGITLITVLMAVALTACGDPIVGTWEMTKIKVDDKEIAIKDYLKQQKLEAAPTITFRKDGTVKASATGNKGTGQWTEEDDKYIITDSSDIVLKGTLKEDQLTLKYDKTTMKLTMVEEEE